MVLTNFPPFPTCQPCAKRPSIDLAEIYLPPESNSSSSYLIFIFVPVSSSSIAMAGAKAVWTSFPALWACWARRTNPDSNPSVDNSVPIPMVGSNPSTQLVKSSMTSSPSLIKKSSPSTIESSFICFIASQRFWKAWVPTSPPSAKL